jgi:diguanylate cyclase (GGDEF)-like protein
MHDTLEEARAADPVERLLEDSWETRKLRPSRRELSVEGIASILFLAVAYPLALTSPSFDPGTAAVLVVLYAVASRGIKFPIGAGYLVPTYLVLVPMLLLLPPAVVPLLAAAGLMLGTLVRVAARRAGPLNVLFSIPDAWHTLGPVAVLLVAGTHHHGAALAGIYVLAFLAGCLVDLIASTVREAAALEVAPRLQLRVIAMVWLVDACLAPLGLVIAHAAGGNVANLALLLLPLMVLLMLVDRDRRARISEAQLRLGLVARERTRLQAAVRRLGEAFAAKLDLGALSSVALHGSIDALDGDAGRLVLNTPTGAPIIETAGAPELVPLLEAAANTAQASRRPGQVERDGAWALALPIGLGGDLDGALVVARRDRAFRDDEQALMLGLVERTHGAAAEIVAHELLREQAITDPLTLLGNRRKLAEDLRDRLSIATTEDPFVLLLFDLDGFKTYNDTFGHAAGDALLARLGGKLAAAAAPGGDAYRLGGDEFCVLIPAHPDEVHDIVTAVAGAFDERGETFVIRASCGTVILPHEAVNADYALQLADKRMYAQKHGRPLGARDQAHDVLRHIMQARQPSLRDHSSGVAQLAIPVGRRLGMSAEQLDELARAAELHDVGKVAIPDAILDKPGPLDSREWEFIRQHTMIGERILSAAPALRPVARVVRASHERWDGAGYPDGLSGAEIPLAARIIAVCDAYDAITSDRCYRKARPHRVAKAELVSQAGTQFDPTVVGIFLDQLDAPPAALETVSSAGQDELGRLAAEVAGRVREVLALR